MNMALAGDTGRLVGVDSSVGRQADYPDATIVEVFADQARRRADTIAVRQWDACLTYRDVAAMAAALAGRLAELGVGRGDLVGVCHDRTPELVPALLGVLACGAAYVPLDPTQPAERLGTVLADAGVSVVVADELGQRVLSLPSLHFGTVEVEPAVGSAVGRVESAVTPSAVSMPSGPADPEDPAYVMYTSGSTGTPKGVVVPHRAVVSLVTTANTETGSGPGAVELGFASIGFDVSVTDIFAPLCTGGTIALVGESDRTDPARLQRFFIEHEVSRACLPVALLPLLDPDRLPALRWLITGAEAPGPEQVHRWAPEGSDRRFVNFYGPTETTVYVCGFVTSGHWDRPIPIGSPLPNQRAYVVDTQLRPVPPGGEGELLIGGAGVAHGYLNRPALTAQRFIADPFGPPGARVYRTGDLVRLQVDGQLLFLGRADRQVKVRGQRVEIAEVEVALRTHPSVGHCVVEAIRNGHDTELVAFVTPAVTPAPTTTTVPGDPAPDPAQLREHCAWQLPAAMVPVRIRVLDALPLNGSGKVDLANLRALDTLVRPAENPPRPTTGEADNWATAGEAGKWTTAGGAGKWTTAEQAVAAAWRRLMTTGGTDLTDDLFACGGHSVTAMRLVAQLRAELGKNVSVEDVLLGRTLAGIAARVDQAPPADDGPRTTEPARPAPSPAQRRLWFLDKYALGSGAYNTAFAERVRGELDLGALRIALRLLQTRQQALRWRFPDRDGVPLAEVAPPAEVPLPVRDVTEQQLAGALAADAASPFDLASGPLWRVVLYRLGPADQVLSFVAHHVVFDGWSQHLFYRDLATCYRLARQSREDVPPLPATFADYVVWRDRRAQRRGDADLTWWTDHLAGAPTVLELPKDRPRPPEQRFRGASAHRWLDHDTTGAVHRAAGAHGTTASAVLLAALGLLLTRVTDRDDLLIGIPAVDRRHPDFQDMVGFFIEIVPLRLRPRQAGAIGLVAQELLGALAHPEAPLERLVDALGAGGWADRNPVVQVLFNMYNFTAPELALDGCDTEPVPVAVPGSPFDLTVYGIERAGRIRIELVYDTDLFDADRMDTLLAAYAEVVGQLARDPTIGADAVRVPHEPRLRATVPDRPSPPSWRAGTAGTAGTAEPRNPTERTIAAVWREVLAATQVAPTDSFFEVGGTSMKAVAVQQQLVAAGFCGLRVVDLFRYPTIRALAGHLDATHSDSPGEPGGGQADGNGEDAVARAARRGAERAHRRTRPAPWREPPGVEHRRRSRE